MRIHPIAIQQNGVIAVTLEAQFVGDDSDGDDHAKIAAVGDPTVNLAGTFSDSGFSFSFNVPTMSIGITTQMHSYTARFFPTTFTGALGPLDCAVSDPTRAAETWITGVYARIQTSLHALRENALLPTFTDFVT